ncbi:hypothetical protein PVAP13_6KG185748 [Panicum virgatum]|uniref:Uncharacterized protein n=1 Tax=Panicum virgatum TaxID=38727 RepID=A0A8T0RC07_PANVG|nr:hypothetical protein PVAP13_6KG185718 [Panicum virgatum]KAG2582641.1 hypothetical protein PVAP13_6KG185718 [Panicum virgatum]KAG2582648.1 hypothetical protein PVAP13_6KG185748 [Panicum virgatum]
MVSWPHHPNSFQPKQFLPQIAFGAPVPPPSSTLHAAPDPDLRAAPAQASAAPHRRGGGPIPAAAYLTSAQSFGCPPRPPRSPAGAEGPRSGGIPDLHPDAVPAPFSSSDTHRRTYMALLFILDLSNICLMRAPSEMWRMRSFAASSMAWNHGSPIVEKLKSLNL